MKAPNIGRIRAVITPPLFASMALGQKATEVTPDTGRRS